MDLASGVAGLLGLAQVVLQEGYKYIMAAKDAREDISNLMNEVAALSGVLGSLNVIVDGISKNSQILAITKHQQVSDCEDILMHLRDLLRKIDPTTTTPASQKDKGKNKTHGGNGTPDGKTISITERLKCYINTATKIAKWPLSKGETTELMNCLVRHKATLMMALTADNTAMLLKVLDGDSQASHHIVNIKSEQERVAEDKRREDRNTKLCWLFPGDPGEKHTDIRQKRHEGTGGWFFDTEEFKGWLRDPRWLFCHGKAGAGKTILTSATYDRIEKTMGTGGNVGLAHMYFGFKDRDEQTPTKIFASILRQLGFQKPELPTEIESLYKKFESQGKTPPLDDLIQATISLAGNFSCVWLFFDALDECNETTLRELLPCIQRLMESGIKGFATSRSHVSEIRSTFEKSIEIELSASKHDMEIVVRSKLSTRFTAELVDEIVARVLGEADGIFLLVAFQVEFIMRKKRPKDVRNCLNKLPTGLDSIYQNILHKIGQGDEDNKVLALKALSWISHATRPLRPKELIEALTVEEDDPAIEDEDLINERDLVDVCGGLVMIDESSETVRFVHFTVQEHLDKSTDIPRGAGVHAMIAKICLTYLSFEAFDHCPSNGINSRWLRERLKQNAFYGYAATNWGYHTKSSDEESGLVEMICTFSAIGFRVQSALHVFLSERLNWGDFELYNSRSTLSVAAIVGLPQLAESLLNLKNLEADLMDKNSGCRTPLIRAAEYGNLAIVELLVNREDVGADSKDNSGRTPLSWAAQRGHSAVVELLVNREDVEADSKDNNGLTPISWAACNGHSAVVELLLTREDVEADSKDNYGLTPISRAAFDGHSAVVELLVNREDVEADSKDNSGRTPLSWAAQREHSAVVELLVNREDVEADSKDNNGLTPISWAACYGHSAVVELLLTREDVEADSKDNYGLTPISRAAFDGHSAVVELLVNREDVEADSKDNCGQTPLSWAVCNRHSAVVELLVNREDVEADSKDNSGRTPLSWAAQREHSAVVELLVNREDVEADSKDNGGQTPLSWAVCNRHSAVVELLVNREDVEADSKDNSGRTPLSWAAQRGHSAVVELLVNREDVEADSKDNCGQTPLSWAVCNRHSAVVELLVNREDVEADSKDNSGRTPISWAACNGHSAVVELLVNREDVEADSKDNSGRTPLSWAAQRGHSAVVELLVNREDVEADSKDNSYSQTPLFWAAENGHSAVVELLVNREDVEADSKDNYGRTPLSWAASNGHSAVVELLVNREDVETDSEDNYGQTPLSWAAEDGHSAVVELLVNREDVEADSKDNSGRTPLSWVAENGHSAVVELLVNREDVEADSKDNSGLTPLSRAAENGHSVVVELLVNREDVEADSKGKSGQTPLFLAARNGHSAVVELLVNREDVEADSKDYSGRTPLSLAAEYGHSAVMELLVNRGDVEADSKDISGHTPLFWAAVDGHSAVQELLKKSRGSS